uniref:DUF58 domain-containing protein n=1 Tax=uncultured Thiotrichaceae bacterium TaxID=298394 RepID=A0A6S6S9T3_9GAMM|nr:MAG: DUF58 domain-containing protein [uncultured Thiotrichaceae bacterium]
MILPARRSFYLLAFTLLPALLVSIFPQLLSVWYVYMAAAGLLLALDAVLCFRKQTIRIERKMPESLSLGVKSTILLVTHNEGHSPFNIQLHDHTPESFDVQGMPVEYHLKAGEYVETVYSARPLKRGLMQFDTVQARILSPLALWWRDTKHSVESEVRVYPNFAAISQYALLATDNHLSHLGIMKRRRRGEGSDFHQLREYRAGDSLRQIDWKASARMQKPVAKEYQDERDQEIVFLLDCSHRMQAKDGELSHFDHTLNAILLLSHVALKQGDAVGLGTFGGEQRWLPARKGQHSLNQILNTLYDLHPTHQAPDFTQAITELLVRQKKRALVVVLSNLRDEDTDELMPALQLLRKRHLLLFASMRELALDQQLEQPVDNLEDALNYAATEQYLLTRQQTLEKIKASGTLCLDVPPEHLSTGLINSYLDIKRSGLL